jgi:hypothetical protein
VDRPSARYMLFAMLQNSDHHLIGSCQSIKDAIELAKTYNGLASTKIVSWKLWDKDTQKQVKK